jgi:hypothetical protein
MILVVPRIIGVVTRITARFAWLAWDGDALALEAGVEMASADSADITGSVR